jgi:hypothetical protein
VPGTFSILSGFLIYSSKGCGQWSLFCPSEAPGLVGCWGDVFQNLYMGTIWLSESFLTYVLQLLLCHGEPRGASKLN